MTPGHAEALPEGPLMGAPTTPSDRQHSGPLCIRHPICAMTYVMTPGYRGMLMSCAQMASPKSGEQSGDAVADNM